jgi:hypothetical protein
MNRSSLSVALLVALLLAACGGPPPADDTAATTPAAPTSPDLVPSTPAITPLVVDYEALQPTYFTSHEIRHLIDGHEVTVTVAASPMPDELAAPDAIRLLTDDDLWVDYRTKLLHWNGARWDEAPLAKAVVSTTAVDELWVDAFAAIPGDAWALVSLWSPDFNRQFCHLADGAWTCARTGPEWSDFLDQPAIAISSGTVWVAAKGGLYRRAADGSLALVSSGQILQLQRLDDGSLACLQMDTPSSVTLHQRVADGSDTILASISGFVSRFEGQSAARLYVIDGEAQGDGSCGDQSASIGGEPCYEPTASSQATLFHVEATGLREIAHRYATGDGATYPTVLPLPDGRVLVAMQGGTYVTP